MGLAVHGTGAFLAALALTAVLLAAAWLWFLRRAKVGPEERERRRRLAVSSAGRMTDAVITDVDDDLISYAYTVRGVTYSASQDVATFRDRLPEDRSALIGPVNLKYDPLNPANSIVICECWTGLRHPVKETGRELPAQPSSGSRLG
jgi:hypothetical protein